MSGEFQNICYLVSAVLFIFGIKGMTHPRSAVRGNLLSAVAMLIAVITTLSNRDAVFNWWVIGLGLIVGSGIGVVLAFRVALTAMPQTVAMLNGSGGLASMLVAWAATLGPKWLNIQAGENIATSLSGFIGTVTLSGSVVAAAKLMEIKTLRADSWEPVPRFVSVVLLLGCLALGVLIFVFPQQAPWLFAFLVVLSFALGVLLIVPIGGADMPVVISLLNSYSGIAAATTGFIISNNVLIITGALVGASGIILTKIMCDAMNRSLVNVLFGGISTTGAAEADDVYAGRVKSTTADEVAMLLADAQSVMIVPGYGMAVSQAQHAVKDLTTSLESRGVDVVFAIHPVAGRMPGHMNVLLAEVDIDYAKLLEMEAANDLMKQVDVAIVIGANDVVNPDARENPSSPIAAMPIINVDQARTVVVIKRSLSPGFAGIPNPLFAADNTLMLFADGKQAVIDVVNAVKAQ